VVDRARLESGSTFTGTGSSNLPLSATYQNRACEHATHFGLFELQSSKALFLKRLTNRRPQLPLSPGSLFDEQMKELALFRRCLPQEKLRCPACQSHQSMDSRLGGSTASSSAPIFQASSSRRPRTPVALLSYVVASIRPSSLSSYNTSTRF
jgi:hypothetical protein